MASGFLPLDRDQQFLLPPSVDDWLPADHAVRFLVDAVASLDLGEFVARHPLGGPGRRAYHPEMMVGLLLWAYSCGVFSSREIERRCWQDVSFRFVAANHTPDHGTIARFRADCEEELKGLHRQVLAMCVRLGLVRLGALVLDGTKVAANASRAANHTADWLDEEMTRWHREAARTDAEEDDAYGDARGDEMPSELLERSERLRRLREAREFLAREQQRTGKATTKSGQARTANVTDPDSRMMMGSAGLVQGYNAQVVATLDRIVVASDVSQQAADSTQFQPMVGAAQDDLAGAGVEHPIGAVVADAGYFTSANATCELGPEPYIATEADHTETLAKAATPLPDDEPGDSAVIEQRIEAIQRWERGELDAAGVRAATGLSNPRVYVLRALFREHGPDGLRPTRPLPGYGGRRGPTESERIRQQMRERLATEQGQRLYRQRAPAVEGVFADTKHNRGFRRFSRRGLDAARSEWSLIHTSGNLAKLRKALHSLTAALTISG